MMAAGQRSQRRRNSGLQVRQMQDFAVSRLSPWNLTQQAKMPAFATRRSGAFNPRLSGRLVVEAGPVWSGRWLSCEQVPQTSQQPWRAPFGLRVQVVEPPVNVTGALHFMQQANHALCVGLPQTALVPVQVAPMD